MSKITFATVSMEMARLHAEREIVLDVAFEHLRRYRPALSEILVERFGTAARAARWMAKRQRSLEDRSVWDLLGEGDEDGVWDLVERAMYPTLVDEHVPKVRVRKH